MRLKTFAILLSLSYPLAWSAHAAQWHSVAQQSGERIEIDKARIARVGEGQTLAWSRLLLEREIRVGDKNYSSVEALNRYDCSNRRFATIKRVYLQGAHPVTEEVIRSPRELSIDAGSIDEQLLVEACRPRTVGEMKKYAELARQAATRATDTTTTRVTAAAPMAEVEQAPAAVMHADMRRLAETRQTPVRPVADTRIGLPSRSELAAKAAADQATLLPESKPAIAAAPPAAVVAIKTPAHGTPAAADTVSAIDTAALPVAPPAAQPSPSLRISRGAPRRKAASAAKTAQPAAPEAPRNISWSYDTEGPGGPANWGTLRSDYATCTSGRRQSPIDIRDNIQVDLEPIKFDYKRTFFRIIDNGHTVQVHVGEGSTLSVMGRRFELVQFHFHRPSEERVNGKAYDMAVHLVHKDLDGQLAVLTVLLERGVEHPLIQTLWNNLPLEIDQDIAPDVAIDLNQLLPENKTYWTYMGSLTTPPCTENVLWMVMKQPQQLSPEQIAIFSRLHRHNARPVQPANNRLIKGSR